MLQPDHVNYLNPDSGPVFPETNKSPLSLDFLDLESRNGDHRWSEVLLRPGEGVELEVHVVETGYVVGQALLAFESLMQLPRDSDGFVRATLSFLVSHQFGGPTTTLSAVAVVHVNDTKPRYVMPARGPSYWNQHRKQHWKRYPLIPISAGIIKQAFRPLALEYDRQMIIHPALFGFQARWRGLPKDESRFTHPSFVGSIVAAQKPISKEAAEEIVLQSVKGLGCNPWKHDAKAASLGKCPVCTVGIPGCPYCFMLPVHPNGEQSKPQEFEYDRARALREQADKDHQEVLAQARIALKKKRMLKMLELKDRRRATSKDSDDEGQSLRTIRCSHPLLSINHTYPFNLPLTYPLINLSLIPSHQSSPHIPINLTLPIHHRRSSLP